MIRATILLLAFALIAAGAAWVADQPGSVSLVWLDYRIDTSVAVLVFAVALVAAVTALIYRFWRWLIHAPGNLSRYWRERRRSRGYRALTQGMVAVAAGDPEEARRQARRADVLLDEPPLTMLLSAQAAQLDGDEAAATKYFTAMLARPETKFLGLRGLIMQASKAGRTAEALGYARAARALRPRTGWLLANLHDLAVRAGDWRQAEEAAIAAQRYKTLSAAEAARQRAIARYEMALAGEAEGRLEEALADARAAIRHDPRFVPAVIAAARLLAAANKGRRATRLIEQSWAEAPHPELAKAYLALEPSADPLARVMRMQRLAARRPDDPESHLALAEAALAARLWGQARHELEALGPAPATARACRLWAALEEAEHGDVKAAHSWLARAALAAPDPSWVCEHCGFVAAAWAPLCAHCGTYNSLAWRRPARAASVELMPPQDAQLPSTMAASGAQRTEGATPPPMEAFGPLAS